MKNVSMRSIKQLVAGIGRQRLRSTGIGAAVATVVAAITGLSLLPPPLSHAQIREPPFANPSEVRDRPGEKRLRAVMELSSGQYQIPNVGTATLRQFRGWDPAQGRPNFGTDIGPGPTLRMRLGDLVEISFLNKIDDSLFPYTFVTNSKPGRSGFGCDKVETTDKTSPGGVTYSLTAFMVPAPPISTSMAHILARMGWVTMSSWKCCPR